jgi:hypothetical protein
MIKIDRAKSKVKKRISPLYRINLSFCIKPVFGPKHFGLDPPMSQKYLKKDQKEPYIYGLYCSVLLRSPIILTFSLNPP